MCMDMLYLKRRHSRGQLGEVCHSQDVPIVRIRSHVCEFCPRCLVADSHAKDYNTVVSCPLCRQLRLFRSGGLPVCQDDGNVRNFRSVAIDSLAGQKVIHVFNLKTFCSRHAERKMKQLMVLTRIEPVE